MSKQIISLHVSDLHLCHTPPSFRSNEKNWYEAMQRPLDEIRALQERLQVPVVYAGDLLNHWRDDLPPECINFVIKHLPFGYAIAGQHDLPNHRLEDIHRSAYWTLVEAGTIKDIDYGKPTPAGGLILHGFPWGISIRPLSKKCHSLCMDVAIIHKCVYTKETAFHNAPEEGRLKHLWPSLEGYDAVHSGDNHISFISGRLCNAGSMMRRTVAEIDHKPMVGLLYSDGTWGRHFLDMSKNVFLLGVEKTPNRVDNGIDTTQFLNSLDELSDSKIDFQTEVKQEAIRRGASKEALEIVGQAMEGEI